MSENETTTPDQQEQARRRWHKEIREWLMALTMGPPGGYVPAATVCADSDALVECWFDVALALAEAGQAHGVDRKLALEIGHGTAVETVTFHLKDGRGPRFYERGELRVSIGTFVMVTGPSRPPTVADYQRLAAQRGS